MSGLDLADLPAPFHSVRCCVMTPLFTPVPVSHQLVGAVVVTDGIRSLPMAFSTRMNGSKGMM
jgi:hypothetical protein